MENESISETETPFLSERAVMLNHWVNPTYEEPAEAVEALVGHRGGDGNGCWYGTGYHIRDRPHTIN